MNSKDKDIALLRMAFGVSKETDDPNAASDPGVAVGVVIAVNDQIVATSANRILPQLRNQNVLIAPNSRERYFLIEHAERCALYDALIAGKSVAGGTMYCTRFPCIDCARALAYLGIRRLVVGAGFRHEGKWFESQRAANRLIQKYGIKIRYIKISPTSRTPKRVVADSGPLKQRRPRSGHTRD